jgi:succinate dehydrogenase/fumarate reductase flavoprotein subunit
MCLCLGAWRQPLGTNSLLDLLVFGKSAGDSAVEDLKAGKAHRDLPKDAADKSLARIAALDNRKGGANVHETRLAMQRVMQDHAGVFRFGDMLKQGVKRSSKSRRLLASSRSRTSRWLGTRPVPKRSKWKT